MEKSTTVYVCVKICVGSEPELCGTDCPGAGEDTGQCRLFPPPDESARDLEEADNGEWYRCRACRNSEIVRP